MNASEIHSRLSFIREAEKLKSVFRTAFTTDGRAESTAAHTWRLCLVAMMFEDQFTHLDFGKILKICVIHDLGEAINGDIPAPEQSDAGGKSTQEREDLLTLLKPLNCELKQEILTLWDDYDNATSEEAKVVKALDKIETLIQHNQGANPPDFDYAFNLTYGQKYTEAHPVFLEIRETIDKDTRAKIKGTENE